MACRFNLFRVVADVALSFEEEAFGNGMGGSLEVSRLFLQFFGGVPAVLKFLGGRFAGVLQQFFGDVARFYFVTSFSLYCVRLCCS